jgi:hypothetical protein
MQCYSFQVAQCVAVDSTHASIMLTATSAPCTPMETSDVPRQTRGLKAKKEMSLVVILVDRNTHFRSYPRQLKIFIYICMYVFLTDILYTCSNNIDTCKRIFVLYCTYVYLVFFGGGGGGIL